MHIFVSSRHIIISILYLIINFVLNSQRDEGFVKQSTCNSLSIHRFPFRIINLKFVTDMSSMPSSALTANGESVELSSVSDSEVEFENGRSGTDCKLSLEPPRFLLD